MIVEWINLSLFRGKLFIHLDFRWFQDLLKFKYYIVYMHRNVGVKILGFVWLAKESVMLKFMNPPQKEVLRMIIFLKKLVNEGMIIWAGSLSIFFSYCNLLPSWIWNLRDQVSFTWSYKNILLNCLFLPRARNKLWSSIYRCDTEGCFY